MNERTLIYIRRILSPASFPKKAKTLFLMYREIWERAERISNEIMLTQAQKIQKLQEIKKAFLAFKKENVDVKTAELGKIFSKEKMSETLVTEVLSAYEDALENPTARIWEEYVAHIRKSASPLGRFWMAVTNENPSTYLPAENLCVVCQILQDIVWVKSKISLFRRVSLPQDILDLNGAEAFDFSLEPLPISAQKSFDEIVARAQKMQEDSLVLPSLIQNRKLKRRVCVILSLTNCVLKRLKQGVLSGDDARPQKRDLLKAWIQGFFQGLFAKKNYQGRTL